MVQCKASPGKLYPLGGTIQGNGVQFAVFSCHATGVSLCLFEGPRDSGPACEIPLDPRLNRTDDIWHVLVEGLKKVDILSLPGGRPL